MKLLLDLVILFILFMLLTDGSMTIKTRFFTWEWSVEKLKLAVSNLFKKGTR
jgi:hypothetical protein